MGKKPVMADDAKAAEKTEQPAQPQHGGGRQRQGAPKRVRKQSGGTNDTQGAVGLKYQEVLALHKELRSLLDIHKAPTPAVMLSPTQASWMTPG
jgi:hypothetical protein